MSPRVPSPDDPVTVALPVSGRVTLRAFPHDGRFVRDIRRAALGVQGSASSEADLRLLLERALRAWYPHVEVRVRDGLAGLAEDDRVWYVLRDGVLKRPNEREDRLYAALSDARMTTDESDVAMGRARAAIAFANQPRPGRGHQAVGPGAKDGPE